MQNNTKKEIWQQLQNAQTIHIAGHSNPDGDAIGACFAMGLALEQMGKDVCILLEHYGSKYVGMAGEHIVKTPTQKADVFLALDCGDELRLTPVLEWLQKADVTINIDHHASNTYFAQYNFVDAEISSTSELVYTFLEEANVLITPDIASDLYMGILYDTGAFRHSSTSPQTMYIAGKLMSLGINHTAIYHKFFDQKTMSELKIIGQALKNAELYFDGRVIVSSISQSEMEKFGSNVKELGSIVNQLKGVDGTEIACFLYEKTDTDIKASFRAEDGRDVCALSQVFGGGGHIKAAGCTIVAPMQTAKELILSELSKQM